MTNNAELASLIKPQIDPGPELDATRTQLDRILKSKTFRRARRLRSLLAYVVNAARAGLVLGQSRTAREVFGKTEGFDPSIDPVIRVQFGRLRRALANYYATEGWQDPILIEIPSRQYMPVFQDNHATVEAPRSRTNGSPTMNIVTGDELEAVRGTHRPLIAVLPFTNLTSDPVQDAFCYGLTEEITNGLASVASVDVVASSSSFQFKNEHVDVREAGRELGVPLILEGSVRIEDGHTRVIVQLARSADGVAVWSDSFDDTMTGSIKTQRAIAQKVMENLPLAGCEH